MSVRIDYSGKRFEVALPEAQLLGAWNGPSGLAPDRFENELRRVLETPLDFPGLRHAVVPGDRVAVPFARPFPALESILNVLARVLADAGVARDDLTLVTSGSDMEPHITLPGYGDPRIHNSDDATQLAYLAATANGNRIYLNRVLTDADLVLPIGLCRRLESGALLGPWSAIHPALSNREALAENAIGAASTDAAEVCWLLGCQLMIGILPGVEHAAGILVGQQAAIATAAEQFAETSWTCRATEHAAMVLAGLGVAWKPTTLEDLGAGLTAAAKLARPGGKIVMLSTLEAEPGPALRRVAELDDQHKARAALKRFREFPDFQVAERILKAQSSADIYLLSNLDDDLVERLGIIPLASPNEASRLTRAADSCHVISPAEFWTVDLNEPSGP